jgi:class 3 adenylate cyclase/tetratricopeptide (TPR) repeat protein
MANITKINKSIISSFEFDKKCGFCGYNNYADNQFCGQCGRPFTEHIKNEKEWRYMSVLFCDVMESTVLYSDAHGKEGEEIVSTAIEKYQEICDDVIELYGGYIGNCVGDGIIGFFGYPHAFEDDTKRAVEAGLEIIDRISKFNKELSKKHGFILKIRLGIHSGSVLVGYLKRRTLSLPAVISGLNVNIAKRIGDFSKENSLVCSSKSLKNVDKYFEYESIGSKKIKGLNDGFEIYRIISQKKKESSKEDPFSNAFGDKHPIIGRNHEILVLKGLWQQAQMKRGQFVTIKGEAGIGKSRLIQALKERLNMSHWYSAECTSYTQHSAFYPLTQAILKMMKIEEPDQPQTKMKKLETSLHSVGIQLAGNLPLIANFLDIPLQGTYRLPLEQQKNDQVRAVSRWLDAFCQNNAIVLVIEDLHWCDISTLAFLTHLSKILPSMKCMLVLSYRPDFYPELRPYIKPTNLNLQPLWQNAAAKLVEILLSKNTVSEKLINYVASKSDGNPLFIEELAKMIEDDEISFENQEEVEQKIPNSLHELLTMQLARIGEAKELAKLASVMGRRFSYNLIKIVSLWDKEKLDFMLDVLIRQGIVVEDETEYAAHRFFIFKHSLIQNASYEMLLMSEKKQYHKDTAYALIETFPEVLENKPEIIAQHLSSAHIYDEAIKYWILAGKRAEKRYTYQEGINYLRKGLNYIDFVIDDKKSQKLELMLQLALGELLMIAHGWGDTAVEKSFLRAKKLCKILKDTSELANVLIGLHSFHQNRGDMNASQKISNQLVELAEQSKDLSFMLEANEALGSCLFSQGKFKEARSYLEKVLEMAPKGSQTKPIRKYGQTDVRILVMCDLAELYIFMGKTDQAFYLMDEALNLSDRLNEPFSTIYTLGYYAYLRHIEGDSNSAFEKAQAALMYAKKYGFSYWIAKMMLIKGWCLAENVDRNKGISMMRESIVDLKKTGGDQYSLYGQVMLAEQCMKANLPHEAFDILETVLDIVKERNLNFFLPKLYLLKSDLYNLLGNKDDAETMALLAQKIIKEQDAKIFLNVAD